MIRLFAELPKRIQAPLATPIDGGSLAMFRIAFGLVMATKAYKWLRPLDGRTWIEAFQTGRFANWIEAVFSGPDVRWLFTYHGFGWVQPLPPPWTTVVCALMGFCGLLVALGWCYRAAVLVLTVSWTYFFLLDETHYNNHYYLVSLLGVLLFLMPADRRYSIRAWLRARRDRDGHSHLVPFWCVFLLRAQLFVVYFYGGLAKLSHQWLVEAEPIYSQLQTDRVQQTIFNVLDAFGFGVWSEVFTTKAFALALSWGGLWFDLAVGFLLLSRRTRWFGFALGLLFHAINHFILFDDIGLFPHLGAATMLIFFEPDWPTRLATWLRRPRLRQPDWGWFVAGILVFPPLGWLLGWKQRPAASPDDKPRFSLWPLTSAFVATWVLVQLLLPLRHYFIPGNVAWTAEGERWSWRMKAGLKHLVPPRIRVDDPVILPSDGSTSVAWEQWPGKRVLYREVDLGRLDWRRMPSLLIVFQPFYGERILFNPWSLEEPPANYAEAVKQALAAWQPRTASQPKIFQTINLSVALAAAERRLQQEAADPSLRLAIASARSLAAAMQRATSAQILDLNLRRQLHDKLLVVAQDSQHGVWFRTLLARLDPFALNGADQRAWLIGIEDAELATTGPNGFVVLRKDKLGWPEDQATTVYVDTERFTRWEWLAFPRQLIHQRASGELQILWNPYVELSELQTRVMLGRPFMCHQYAEHIAERWQEEFGRRPAVHFTSYAALAPEAPQLLFDPDVNLADAPLNLFGHSDWILPWQGDRTEDAPVVDSDEQAEPSTPR